MKSALACLILVVVPLAARAETLPQTCFSAWWIEKFGVPERFEAMPLSPTIRLPAIWSSSEEANLGTQSISVVVSDSQGASVSGQIGIGGVQLGDSLEGRSLNRQAWWRPDAELTPGFYSVTMKVSNPPATAEYNGCDYQPFEKTLVVEVADRVLAQPTLRGESGFGTIFDDSLSYGPSCNASGAIRCSNEEAICCWYLWPDPMYQFQSIVDVVGVMPGGPYYYMLEVDAERISGGEPRSTIVVHPAPIETWTNEQNWNPPPNQHPRADLCFDARLRSLHTGEIVASVRNCADTSNPSDPTPILPPYCAPAECAKAAVELGPSSADGISNAEINPESSNVSELEASIADPALDGATGGCGSEPSPTSGAVLAIAIGWISRSQRSRHAVRSCDE